MINDVSFHCQLIVRAGGKEFLGPDEINLMKSVREHGSLTQAAKEMSVSYSEARRRAEQISELANQDIILTHQGGKGGGSAELTPAGVQLLEAYDELLKRMQQFLDSEVDSFME